MFQVYPQLIPQKNTERYVPRCFGFKVHASAALLRWQEAQRAAQRRRLIDAGVEVPTPEEEEERLHGAEEEDEEIEEEEAEELREPLKGTDAGIRVSGVEGKAEW